MEKVYVLDGAGVPDIDVTASRDVALVHAITYYADWLATAENPTVEEVIADLRGLAETGRVDDLLSIIECEVHDK